MKELVFPYDRIRSADSPFVGENLNRAALIRFLERARERGVDVHAFEVYRNNELAVRMSLPPYDCTDKRHFYSLSKSFVSTAIGLACDAGLLKVSDRLVDLFPDKLPETVSENLAKCTVHHVLSMNSGVGQGTWNACQTSDDLPRAFLASDFLYEPGTHYCYDTGATAMLAAIILRVTGITVTDYLDINLFRYMGIRDIYWNRTADGSIQGGIGLHASCDDAAKLGLLYLNRGMWNGRRLLSDEWVKAASTTHSDNGPNRWADWASGYCYQFWTCSRGGYRGDGAYGQYTFILEDIGVVATALCEAENLQLAVDTVHEMALELFREPFEEGEIEKAAAGFYGVSATETPDFSQPRVFKMAENNLGITFVKLMTEEDRFVFSVSDGASLTHIRCANGCWAVNRATVDAVLMPYPAGFKTQMHERTSGLAASYIYADDKVRAELRNLASPHHVTLEFAISGDALTVTASGHFVKRSCDPFVITGIEV